MLVAIALALFSVALVIVQRELLIDRIEDLIAARASDIGRSVISGDSSPLIERRDEDAFVQVVSSDGTVVSASSNVSGQPSFLSGSVSPGETRFFTINQAIPGEGESFRVVALGVDSPDGPVTVLVGEALESVSDSTQALIVSLLIGIPILTVVVGLSAYFLTHRALRPVEAIRSRVEEVEGEIGGRRVPEPEQQDEIGRLAKTMNSMLARVEAMQERQKRFASDASHELRTPLTAIRANLEIGLEQSDNQERASDLVRSSLNEVERMEQLMESLLSEALGAAGTQRNITVVDMDDLVLEEASAFRHTSGKTIDTSGVSAAQLDGDREQLRRVLRNLLSNATRHAENAVSLTLREVGADAVLTVTDDGPGVPDESLEEIFERFSRLEHARERDAGGAGLGLSIVKSIVESHGGEVFVDADYKEGAKFVVRLPISK